MHFELDADKATVAAVADRLRQQDRLPDRGREVVRPAREALEEEDAQEQLPR